MTFLAEYPELTRPMRSVLERMARLRHQPMHLLTPQEARAGYEGAADVLEVPRRALARVEDLAVPARGGATLPARLYQGDAPSRGVLLYFHGGGFTIGSIGTHDILCRELAALGQCTVVSLGYRLAPEHRFPIAVDDAWAISYALFGQGLIKFERGELDEAGALAVSASALLRSRAGRPRRW